MKIVLKNFDKLEQVKNLDVRMLEKALRERLWGDDVVRRLESFVVRKKFYALRVEGLNNG